MKYNTILRRFNKLKKMRPKISQTVSRVLSKNVMRKSFGVKFDIFEK